MSQPSTPQPTREEAIKALWQKGIISWKLDSNQKEMHDMVRNSPHGMIVIGASRQIGKSFAMTAIAVETCIQKPYQTVKFVAPKTKDIRRIIAPLIREICADAPKHIRPIFKSQESTFRFPNGSEIQLAGTDNGHAESIRGTKAHLCIVDEAGFCDDLEYVVNSILMGTLTTTGGKIVLISTPSKTSDHPFMTFLKQAELEGRYIKKTIYDNPRLTPEAIARIADTAGGVDSVNFQREYMVEMRTSEEDAIIPEFTPAIKLSCVIETPRPPYFDAYVSMDIGGRDYTAVLFGYYDFAKAALVIEDEFVMGYTMTSDVLAQAVKEREQRLWNGKLPHLRVADNNNLILLNDLMAKHQISFVPTLKDNFDAALNHVRMLIKAGRIIIHPRCKTLVYHIESGIWNKARTSFARSADKGHFDCIAALIYMCRNINFNKNPFPDNIALSEYYNYHSDAKPNAPKGSFETGMSEVFKVKKQTIRSPNDIMRLRGRNR